MTLTTVTQMTKGYIDVEEFQRMTGIDNRNPDQIKLAIENTAKEMRRQLFVREVFTTTRAATIFQVDSRFYGGYGTSYGNYRSSRSNRFFADFNLDRKITGEDFRMNEIYNDATNGISVWVPIPASEVFSVNESNMQITMNNTYPTVSGRVFQVEYWWTRYKLADELDELKELNMLLATGECYRMLMAERLDEGISNWSVGGLDVEFNMDVVKNLLDLNKEQVTKKLNILRPFVGRRSTLQGEYDLQDKRGPMYI